MSTELTNSQKLMVLKKALQHPCVVRGMCSVIAEIIRKDSLNKICQCSDVPRLIPEFNRVAYRRKYWWSKVVYQHRESLWWDAHTEQAEWRRKHFLKCLIVRITIKRLIYGE